MDKIGVNDLRRQVGEYVNQTYYAGRSFVLTRGDKEVAALVPMATLTRLYALELAEGLRQAQAPASPGPEPQSAGQEASDETDQSLPPTRLNA